MTTDDFDALEDMQNAARALAEKINARARQHTTSAEARTILYDWGSRINAQANDFAGEILNTTV